MLLRVLNRRVQTVLPIETKHERVRYNLRKGALRTGREQRNRSSSADGRAGRAFDPDRPSSKLAGPARRMAELVVRLVQLGGWLSWSCVRSSSADGRAGRAFDPARPSAEMDCLFLVMGCVEKVSARKCDFIR